MEEVNEKKAKPIFRENLFLNNLHGILKANKITHKELAENIGVKTNTVDSWFVKNNSPQGLDHICKIVNYLSNKIDTFRPSDLFCKEYDHEQRMKRIQEINRLNKKFPNEEEIDNLIELNKRIKKLEKELQIKNIVDNICSYEFKDILKKIKELKNNSLPDYMNQTEIKLISNRFIKYLYQNLK